MLRAKWLYGITACAGVICSLFASGSLDIAVYDTYYVIDSWQIFLLMAFFYLLCSIIVVSFEKTKRKWSRVLSLLHYFITTACILVVVSVTYFSLIKRESYEDFRVVEDFDNLQSQTNNIDWIALCVLFLILSQLILLINIIRGFLFKKN